MTNTKKKIGLLVAFREHQYFSKVKKLTSLITSRIFCVFELFMKVNVDKHDLCYTST